MYVDPSVLKVGNYESNILFETENQFNNNNNKSKQKQSPTESQMLTNHINEGEHFTFLNMCELICIPKKGLYGLLTELNTFKMESYYPQFKNEMSFILETYFRENFNSQKQTTC